MKFGELLNSELPIITCFYADWNSQSTQAIQSLKHIALITEGKAKVVKMDINQNKELARALEIGVLPTLIIYRNKKQIMKYEGVINVDEILQSLVN